MSVSNDDLASILVSGILAGGVVGVDATQTLTNKKLEDETTTIIDDIDATKAVKFELAGVTTGTTRILTVPDADGTIALASGAGETNTASNVGAEIGVFLQKTGVDLELKSMKALSNKVAITAGSATVDYDINENNLTIANMSDASSYATLTGAESLTNKTMAYGSNTFTGFPAAGETNTASNVGTAVPVFKQKTGVNLEFHNIKAGSTKIAVPVADGSNDINLDVNEANLTIANMSDASSYATLTGTETLTNKIIDDAKVKGTTSNYVLTGGGATSDRNVSFGALAQDDTVLFKVQALGGIQNKTFVSGGIKLNDSSGLKINTFTASTNTVNVNVNIPALTTSDDFVFEDNTATLQNKTLNGSNTVFKTGNNAGVVTMPSSNDPETFALLTFSQTMSGKTMTASSNNINARSLVVGSGAGSVSTYVATAPTSGQVLTANGATTAIWSTPSTQLYGSVFYQASSDGISSTTSTSYINKLSYTTPALPSGAYMLNWSTESYNTNSDKRTFIKVFDGTTILNEVTTGAKDTPFSMTSSGQYYYSTLVGAITFTVDYKAAANTSSIKNCRINIVRIS